MPYIDVTKRATAWFLPEGAGPLCYALSKQIQDYRLRQGDSFATFVDILAALEAAKLEFHRCVMGPYEQKRRESNGDVWS